MINLETISQELARYKEAKEKAVASGPFLDHVCNIEFALVAKYTQLETYCEQLIEEVILLKAKIEELIPLSDRVKKIDSEIIDNLNKMMNCTTSNYPIK